MTRVLGVDGNSMVHRAWHGGTDEFLPNWVSARVVGMLATAWAEGPYDAVYVAFDGPDNIRKEQFPGYKANRAEKDPDLVTALADVQVDLTKCGLPVACEDRIEADDLLAHLAVATAERGIHCDILSSDRDLLALIDPLTRLLRPRNGLHDLQPYDEARVVAEFGVTPIQYRHLAALRGDPSDGLDGVRGIGPRAASVLIRRYGSIDGVYEAVEWLAPKQEAALRAGREIAYRNLALMSPIEGIDIDLDWILGVGVDPDTIDSHLVPLGHGWAAGRMRHVIERGPLEPSAPMPGDEHAPDAPADPLAGVKVEVASVEADQAALFLMQPVTRTITTPLPVDLRRTLGPMAVGSFDPTMHVEARHVWRCSHTPQGPTTFHVRAIDDRTFEVEAWGPGATWMTEQAPSFLGALDDLHGFEATAHPKVERAHRRLPGVRVARSGLVADLLVQTILGQKVTGTQAHKAWYGLVRKHGHDAPGPVDLVVSAGRRRVPLRLPPTMADVGRMSYWAFHPLGVEQRRAETIIRAARRIDRLEEASTMVHEDALRRLTALPGLGPWTAGVLLRHCLGDPDGVEVGDYHLPDMVSWTLAGEARGTDERMLELLAPFAPHRGRALMLLKYGGSGKPKRGPRMTIHAVEDL